MFIVILRVRLRHYAVFVLGSVDINEVTSGRQVARKVGRADAATLSLTLGLADLALHVPVPLIDLTLLETETLLKLHNLRLLPDWVLFEFTHEDLILFAVLSKALLCFFGALDPVADDDARNAAELLLPLALGHIRRILVRAELFRSFLQFFGHFQGGRVLMERCL